MCVLFFKQKQMFQLFLILINLYFFIIFKVNACARVKNVEPAMDPPQISCEKKEGQILLYEDNSFNIISNFYGKVDASCKLLFIKLF